mgnify:CR=1 FL=1|jgi:hypothetical protein
MKTLNVTDSLRKRKQSQMDSYDSIGDGSMQSKNPKSNTSNVNNRKTYEVKFIDGTINIKVLLKELIACRVNKKYGH